MNSVADLSTQPGEDALDGQVVIFAVEIISVSSRITAEVFSKDEMGEEICCMLQAQGWEWCALVTYSWMSPSTPPFSHDSLRPSVDIYLFRMKKIQH